MKVTWQVAVDPLPERVQLVEENAPGPLLEKLTIPIGVMGVPGLISFTVTVHVVGVLRANGVEHETETDTTRFNIVSEVWAELGA